MILWMALSLWIAALWWFLYLRFSMTAGRQRRRIAYKPQDALTPDQLFGCLLSASLAVLEQDNFNQLESALSVRQAQQRLAMYWCIESRGGWSNAIEGRLQSLGALSARERTWIDQWSPDSFKDTEGWNALQDVCTFLSMEARVVDSAEIHACHMNTVAWDVQQVAYMVRLGTRAGYASPGMAQNILQVLRREAQLHYDSWNDYFLSSLIGMGMRNHVDIFSPGDWHRIAQTYPVLLSSDDSLLQHAASWSSSDETGSNAAHVAHDLVRGRLTVLAA